MVTAPLSSLLNRCFRRRGNRGPTRHDREMVREIREAGSDLQSRSDQQLRDLTDELRESGEIGQSLMSSDLLVPAFALVNEAIRRTLGITYYDVQLLSGLALARGSVAEMQTGEGKTFVAALPSFVHALSGRGGNKWPGQRRIGESGKWGHGNPCAATPGQIRCCRPAGRWCV